LTNNDDQADPAPDLLGDSTGSYEFFRCTRGDETRVYYLRSVTNGAELWRIDEHLGITVSSVKESHLNGPEEAAAFLEEIRRTMKAGGWR
jgi:hypothetical protein